MNGEYVPLLQHEKFPNEYVILVKEKLDVGSLNFPVAMPVLDFLTMQDQFIPVTTRDH